MSSSNNAASYSKKLKSFAKNLSSSKELLKNTTSVKGEIKKSSNKSFANADKLSGSKFRWINEKLYTITGKEAYSLFQQNPEYFEIVCFLFLVRYIDFIFMTCACSIMKDLDLRPIAGP